MNPAGFVFLEEFLDRTLLAEWKQKLRRRSNENALIGGSRVYLKLGIAEIDEDRVNAVFFQRHGAADGLGVQDVLEETTGLI